MRTFAIAALLASVSSIKLTQHFADGVSDEEIVHLAQNNTNASVAAFGDNGTNATAAFGDNGSNATAAFSQDNASNATAAFGDNGTNATAAW